jgi:hypothetical protein
MTPLQVAEERNRILRSLLELTAPLEKERPDVTAVQQMVAAREELLRLLPGPPSRSSAAGEVLDLEHASSGLIRQIVARDEEMMAALRGARDRVQALIRRTGTAGQPGPSLLSRVG